MGSDDDETAELMQLDHSLAIVVLDLRKGYQYLRDRLYEIAILMDILKPSKRICESSYVNMERSSAWGQIPS